MTHAALIQVKIEPGSDIKHRHSILTEFILPQARDLPGFKTGLWLNDGAGTGTCVVQFTTQQQAEDALSVLAPDNGPQVLHSGTCEVELEA
jgi:hypothetical protein